MGHSPFSEASRCRSPVPPCHENGQPAPSQPSRLCRVRNRQISCYLRPAITIGQFQVSFDLEITCFVANIT